MTKPHIPEQQRTETYRGDKLLVIAQSQPNGRWTWAYVAGEHQCPYNRAKDDGDDRKCAQTYVGAPPCWLRGPAAAANASGLEGFHLRSRKQTESNLMVAR
jgi:hypothetical protein